MKRLFAVFLVPIVAGYLLALKLFPIEKPAGFRARNIWILVILTIIICVLGSYQFITNPERWPAHFGLINNKPFWILAGITFYIGLSFLCMGFVGAIYFLFRKDRAVLLFSIAAIVPILALLILSLFQYSAVRYAFVSLTSWLILASAGVWELVSQSKGRHWVLAAGVLLILLLEPMGEVTLYYRYQNGNREDWKTAFALVNRLKEPDDKVVVTNTLLGDYYTEGIISSGFGRVDRGRIKDDR